MRKILILCLLVSGCAWTPQQKQITIGVTRAVLSVSQNAADLFARVIIARANSDAELDARANWLDSVASGLRSIQHDSAGLITADLVGSTVREWTDPNKVDWRELADLLADKFADSPLPPKEKLEVIAVQANIQAQSIREALVDKK